MSSVAPAVPTSKGMLWTGRILSGLVVALLLFGASYGFLHPEKAREDMRTYGYPDSVSIPISTALLVSTLLYAIPRTSVFGAIMLTGYLGDRHSRTETGAELCGSADRRHHGMAGNLFARSAAARGSAVTQLTQRFASPYIAAPHT